MKKSVVGGKKNKSKKLFFFSPPNPATPPEFSVNILVPNPKNYQDVPNSQSPKNTQQNPMRQSVSRASAANPLDLSRPLGRKAGGGLPRSEILPSRQSPAEKIKKKQKESPPPESHQSHQSHQLHQSRKSHLDFWAAKVPEGFEKIP